MLQNFIIFPIIAFFFLTSTVKIVQEKTVKIVQRLGRFNRILYPGINFCIPIFENIAGTVSLKVQQLDINLETKTQDDVYVKLQVSVYVQIMKIQNTRTLPLLMDSYRWYYSPILNVVAIFLNFWC